MDFLKFFGFGVKKGDAPVSDELAHINQEMYKKSVELNERNKTLSLLQKIDEIILSDIAHPNELAQQVASLLVTDIDFQLVSLFLYDKEAALLRRIAFSQAASETGQTSSGQDLPYFLEIPLTDTDNSLVQAINDKTMKSLQTISGVLLPSTASVPVGSVFISPLIVRGVVIGVLVICARESQEELSQYHTSLLHRLGEVIGIAMDNALLYNEVQMSNEKLKELDKLKNEFVSVASHELRTPMTAVKSYLWMTIDGRGGELTEKQKYYLGRAYSSVDRLIKLVNDMLNISRIESGRITINLQPVDLQKLTQEVVEEVMPRAQELEVNVEKIATDVLPQVNADADKIKEVLFNLLGNSLKFTPKGGKVTVSFSHNGDMIETTIKDTGAGLEQEDIPKLFQKFALLTGSYTTNQVASSSGTGLGLYICKSIVELHGGKIGVTSEGKGKGCEFTFSLKVVADNV